ncbi:Aldo/keto reductase family proteins [Ceraceosorus bombacis]|uniref:Aldo/keto reductase family proteins n=1 Tax=Ceraceosorus bombacis TaxID=401625 RepID=A0A0P1BPI4_9BASI|nr:Aldo/keto reductase family proteins [Ceraceosorus bombacis]
MSHPSSRTPKAAPVPYFTLNNGVKMPAVLMGCWQGDFEGEGKNLDLAIRNGYRGLDTATQYKNEAIVGQVIAESGLPRDQLFVTTKLANSEHHDVAGALSRSLEKLGGQIDLYLMHWPQGVDPSTGALFSDQPRGNELPDYVRTWKEMEKAYKASNGKVRAIGVSNFSIKTFTELLKHAEVVPAVNQIEGHPYLPEAELVQWSNERKIHTSLYSPLGQSNSPLLKDDLLNSIATSHNATVAQVIFAWAIASGLSVNPRSTNPERQVQNITLITLTDEEVKRIDTLHKENGKHTRLCNVAWSKENSTAAGWTLEQLGWEIGFETA